MSINDRHIINDVVLMEEWDWNKNNEIGLNPEKISMKSDKKPWWICKACSASWQTAVYIRSNGHGCPICSRKTASQKMKINQPYVATNYELMQEWDIEKNSSIGLYPDKITCGSSKKVWWLCKKCGHSWCAIPRSRKDGTGCPVCSRSKAQRAYKNVRLSYNSLLDNRPDLLDEWDYELNRDISPSDITASSDKKVWWKCKVCNQSWIADVAHRSMGRGCPICAGQKLVAGVNDLATVNPKLADEWDYDNNEMTPQHVSARNNISAAWICSVCGHRWNALISARNRGTGCPQCQKSHHTSLPEQILFFYIKQAFEDAINGFVIKDTGRAKIIDIFIPSLKLAIEYDGSRWHKNAEQDVKKTKYLSERGIRLIRIRESNCPDLKDNSFCIIVEYNPSNYLYLESAIKGVWEYIMQQYNLRVTVSVDIENDIYQILSSFESNKKEKSLTNINPIVASEWDYDKNGSLTPDQVIALSDKKFWWKCKECGYSWKASVYDRHYGHGCRRCAGLVVWEGVNDFQTKHPELLSEWDYEKNESVIPSQVAYRGNKKVWWSCQVCGFSWNARVADRSAGSGCPACAGKAVMEGKTDLATINPWLAEEWDHEKNGALTPKMVLGGSNKKIWWKCRTCSHSWTADVYSRNIAGHGCPKCGRKRSQKKTSYI